MTSDHDDYYAMEWPKCCDCGEEFHPKRKELGYPYCTGCAPARTGEPKVFIADVSKSNPTFTSDSRAICGLPDRLGGSCTGPTKHYMQLESKK